MNFRVFSLLCLLLLLALGVLAGYLMNWLGDPVTPANFERVKMGMTEEEVESLLGWGQREYRWAQRRWPEVKGRSIVWIGDEYAVVVWFDGEGRAVNKVGYEWKPWKFWEHRTWQERLRRFFRLELGPPNGIIADIDD